MSPKDTLQSPVGPIIRHFLRRLPAFSASALGEWRDLVGDQVAQYSQPKSLKQKLLTIIAHDSVWKHHLDLNREALIEKINKNRPEPIVEKIVVRVGELPQTPPVLNPRHRELEKLAARRSRSPKKEKIALRELTPEEKELLKKLPDPDLRAIGKRLLRRLPLDEKEGGE